MARKKPEKPERPKLRTLFPESGPKWLILDPARLAPVGGVFFATLAMIYYVALQAMGRTIAPVDVILGLLRTFVVSYAGTGLFVYFVLRIWENESPEEEDPRALLGLFDDETSQDDDHTPMAVPGMNPDAPEQGEEPS